MNPIRGRQLPLGEPVGDDLGKLHVEEHAARSAEETATGHHRPRGADHQGRATERHQSQRRQNDRAVAEARSQETAGHREDRAGQEVEADQRAELRVTEAQIRHQERAHRRG